MATRDRGARAVAVVGECALSAGVACVYGDPPAELASPPTGAMQVSPLWPGAGALEDMAPGGCDALVLSAPPGTLERRYAIAVGLLALAPGAPLTVLAPKDRGGSRLGAELKAFGCQIEEAARRHFRICHTLRPAAPTGIDAAVEAGRLRLDAALGLWTQPGVFSWDRPDPGTTLLLEGLAPLKGAGADLGCGLGPVARAALASPAVTRLELVDLDRRAIEAARRNVDDPRAAFHWADARTALEAASLDFVVMNPPFHARGGRESYDLGQDFVRAAHRLLRKGGTVRLVANRHLPYEEVLSTLFTRCEVKADRSGFKVLEARK